jgi:hypothetical protein
MASLRSSQQKEKGYVVQRHQYQEQKDAMTDLAVQMGRLEEQMTALSASLIHHMRDEHEEFRQTLKKVEQIQETIIEIKAAAKMSRWTIWVVGIFAGAIVWIKDHITFRS